MFLAVSTWIGTTDVPKRVFYRHILRAYVPNIPVSTSFSLFILSIHAHSFVTIRLFILLIYSWDDSEVHSLCRSTGRSGTLTATRSMQVRSISLRCLRLSLLWVWQRHYYNRDAILICIHRVAHCGKGPECGSGKPIMQILTFTSIILVEQRGFGLGCPSFYQVK